MKRVGFKLARLTVLHFDFVHGLYDSGMIDERCMEELAAEGLRNVPKEARNVLYPMTGEIVRLITQHHKEGRSKIAIYRDDEGQRYIAADYVV